MRRAHGIFMFSGILLCHLLAYAKSNYNIGLHQTGKQAEVIYDALDVPEQIDKANSLGINTKTYKIGKNIICLKTLVRAVHKKEKATYFCSSGYNSLGVSDSRD
ncbi:MAG: hypothetical protein ACXVB1_10735 [Pseudobdellovibrionaceae bacterium]